MNAAHAGWCGIALVCAATGAFAQSKPEDVQDDAAQLDTVVVTARRRAEDLQDVPIAITALDETELRSRGIEDLAALGAATPNLTIHPARAFNGTLTAFIRGVGQFDPVWGIEPGVAVYVDDVYLARPQAALLEVLDVERIEVLRGPQGTLYGKNTIGGAIKYVTRPVEDHFSGSARVTLGSYARRDAKGVVNVPLGERVQARLAIARLLRDGFGHNLVTGDDVNDVATTVARATVAWQPAADVDVVFAWDAYRNHAGVRGPQRLIVNRFDPARTPPDPGRYDVRNDAPNVDDVESDGASATVSWRIRDGLAFKSVSAYREGDSAGTNDFDSLPLPLSMLMRVFRDHQATQEFQLQWEGARWHGVAGLYGFDGDSSGIGDNVNSNRTFLDTRGGIQTRALAAYGDVVFDIARETSVEIGLRYTDERKRATVFNQNFTDGTFTVPTGRVAAHFTDAHTFRGWSPRLAFTWKPAAEAMLYASATRGFKSGTYNIRANTFAVPASALPIEDETATTYEAGAKTRWFDGRLALDAAVFHTDYRDIQLSVFTSYDSNADGVEDAFFGDFKNAGAGTMRGAELEMTMQLGRHLRLLANAGYLDTRYDEFLSAGVDMAAIQKFPNAPRWTGGASAIVEAPLPQGSALTLRVDGRYQARTYPTTDRSEAIAQPGYSVWNASIAWRSPLGAWEVALSGQNLADTVYRTSGFDFPLPGILTVYYGAPRTFALSVLYTF